MNKIPVIEAYKCLQGEGPLSGVPHILIRTTGCKLRCQFGNSFCDTPYASWKPEKPSVTYTDIDKLYKPADWCPNHTMITGGEPTMHKEFLIELINHIIYMVRERDEEHTITIETAGTDMIDFKSIVRGVNIVISLSPKLQSSTPVPGVILPFTDKVLSQSEHDMHEKNRTNIEAMKQLIDNADDYYLKPVINFTTEQQDLDELAELQEKLSVPNNKVWLMPAGVTNEQLSEVRKYLFDFCIQYQYNYTDRLQVITYGDKRGV